MHFVHYLGGTGKRPGDESGGCYFNVTIGYYWFTLILHLGWENIRFFLERGIRFFLERGKTPQVTEQGGFP